MQKKIMIYRDVEYWLSSIDFKKIKNKVRTRDVLIWGYSKGSYLRRSLERNGVTVNAYIDLYKQDFFMMTGQSFVLIP